MFEIDAHDPSNPSPRRRRASVLATSAACEWRSLRFDLGWWSALAASALCVAYAVSVGRARVEQRSAAVAQARADETDRLARLTDLLRKIERGEAPAPDAPYRDPRNAAYVGRGQGAAAVALEDLPTAPLASGLSDLYPQVIKVASGPKDGFLFTDEIANPTRLLGGEFDFAFVVVFLFPAILIALGHDVLSAEREQGTLAMTLAASASLTVVLVGKLIVRLGGVVVVVLGTLVAGLAASGFDFARGTPALLIAAAAVVIYAAFWTSLILLVNSFGLSSAMNATSLAVAWPALILVAPAAISAWAEVVHPAPARSLMILAVRSAAVDVERERAAAEDRFRDEHAPRSDSFAGPIADARTRETLAVTIAADRRADEILAEQEEQARRRRGLAERLAFALPPALLHDALEEIAGNGRTRWDDFLERIDRFHGEWKAFFFEPASRGAALTTADYARFPRFPQDPASARIPDRGLLRIAGELFAVALLSLLCFLPAHLRLRRPTPG
ncbi:MAG: DUF3526 domain-containing protein [Isosphaeraceae bacterium]|nr:DUF3526 domain-containing protein [Isosphaeraceae bacterium]